MPTLTLAQQIDQIAASLRYFWPETALVGLTLLLLCLDLVLGEKRKNITLPATAFVGFLGAIVLLFLYPTSQKSAPQPLFLNLLLFDAWGILVKAFCLFSVAVTVLLAFPYRALKENPVSKGEFYTLLPVLALGMCLMATANHWLTVYLGVEMVSIASYILTLYTKKDKKASEAAMKYVIYGSFSSGLMLYGISLLYGLCGSLYFDGAAAALAAQPPLAVWLTFALIFSGFAYKTASFPFHFWAPDVYEGSLTPVTALFSTGPKIAGFAMLFRFLEAFPPNALPQTYWFETLAVLSIAVTTFGNLAALGQKNFKRLLAYSGVAHTGFLLMAVLLPQKAGYAPFLFYVGFYALANLSAFALAIYLGEKTGGYDIENWKGLAGKTPIAAAAMTVALVSLTGLPPTVGFVAKLNLFLPVWQEYSQTQNPVWLALILSALINTVLSLFYYLRVPAAMILQKGKDDNPSPLHAPRQIYLAIGLLFSVPLLLFGFWGFDRVLEWLRG